MKDLCIRESYKDKNGDEKVSWNRVGALIETREGKQYVKLHHIPGVLISVFERKEKIQKPVEPTEQDDFNPEEF